MPAAGALSSSSRQRKMMQNKGPLPSSSRRGGLDGSGRDGRGSQRNLMRASQSQRNLMGASSGRNLTASSQKNQTGSFTSPRRGSGERGNFSESMPTLREDLLAMSGLEDSVRTNPELYLIHDQLEKSDRSDRSEGVELQLQPTPQDEDRGGGAQGAVREEPPNHVQQGESIRTHATQSAGSFKAKPRGSFGSARSTEVKPRGSCTEIIPEAPAEKHWWPTWMNSTCNVRLVAGRVVNDDRVQNTILLMIVINSIMMGVATFPFVKENPDLLQKFQLADQIFLIIFTVESAMQLLYFGWNLFKDGFLVFDLLIVVMSWALEGTQVIRAFRIFRALRLITRIDTMRNLVQALFSVVPKMTAIFMLLLLIFYIFSVMFTQLFKDMEEEELVNDSYFNTLYDSLFTLFQMMTLDNWADILYQIQITYPWAWLPFVVFIIITGFVVVNLIIAVICDAVHVLGKEDKAHLEGCDSEDLEPALKGTKSYDSALNQMERIPYPANRTQRRLEELQNQLEEMVLVQEHMRSKVEKLVKQMENAARESGEMIESTLVEKQAGRSRTMPAPPKELILTDPGVIPKSMTR